MKKARKGTCARVRIYPPVVYFLLEKWLKKMSTKGLHLVNCNFGIIYRFEKGIPEEKEYFVWDTTRTGEGKYSIELRYPLLRKEFGVKEKRSKLNKNSSRKHFNIIEVDKTKLNTEQNLFFSYLRKERNRLYLLRFVNMLIVVAFLIICFLSTLIW